MTGATDFSDSEAIRHLQRMSEARGMKFYLDPPRDIVPKFFADFQPDALVVGPDGGIVVEVVARGAADAGRKLSDISALVSRQDGWEFRAILLNPSIDRMPAIDKPAPGQIEASLQEIRALAAQGHRAAALVLAYATLESLARLTIVDGERPLAFSTPAAAVQQLAEQGYLENGEADPLRDMVTVRNRIVHGDLSVDVQTNQIDGILRTLRQVATDIVTN